MSKSNLIAGKILHLIDFRRKHDLVMGAPDEQTLRAWYRQLVEEVGEIGRALYGENESFDYAVDCVQAEADQAEFRFNPIEFADGVADVEYVVGQGPLIAGYDGEAALAEVIRSNATKVSGGLVGGKVQKGPNYSPPNLAPLFAGKTLPARPAAMLPQIPDEPIPYTIANDPGAFFADEVES